MKNIKHIGVIVIILFIALIYAQYSSCPKSCDDNNKCTLDSCSVKTLFRCTHKPITSCLGDGVCEQGEYGTSDCPNCNDNNACTDDSYNYTAHQCINKEKVPCCGNLIPENGETCSSCPQDVKCKSGELCCGTCMIPNCSMNSDCNDNKANTLDLCRNPGRCGAVCTNDIITKCINDDGYCPQNCNTTNDNDCLNVHVDDTHYTMADVVSIQNFTDDKMFLNDFLDQYCYKASSQIEETTSESEQLAQTTYHYTVCVTTPYSKAIKSSQSDARTITGLLQYGDMIITIIGPQNSVQLLMKEKMHIETDTEKIYQDNEWLQEDKSKLSVRFPGYESIWDKVILLYINKDEILFTLNMSQYR